MKLPFVLVLSLFSCTPAIDGATYVETLCMESVYTRTQTKVNITRLQHNINLARDTFVWMGLSKSNQAFCDEFRTQVVIIEDVDDWQYWATDVMGSYLPGEGIKLCRSGRPLLHELFHAVDFGRRQSVGTIWHENWDVNGQYALSEWYFLQAEHVLRP